MDKQRNKLNSETITYYLNYTVIKGAEPVIAGDKVIRPRVEGIDKIGLEIRPRPQERFTHYLPCEIQDSKELFEKAFKPNS
jgi:hypothetical protein